MNTENKILEVFNRNTIPRDRVSWKQLDPDAWGEDVFAVYVIVPKTIHETNKEHFAEAEAFIREIEKIGIEEESEINADATFYTFTAFVKAGADE